MTILGQGCFKGLSCLIRNKADSGQDQAPPKENAMACVGVNIGALTVKVVTLRGDDRIAQVMPHQGRPLAVLKEILAGDEFADAEYFGVSGHLGHLTEVAAIQRALSELDGDFDAVVSLGGESFLVYLLTDGQDHQCSVAQQMRRRERRVFCAADRPDGARPRGSDPAFVAWQSRAAGLALLRPLQIGHHTQAQPQRGHAGGHSAHTA